MTLSKWLLVTLLLPVSLSWAKNLDDVTQSLISDIQQAKRMLEKEQAAITQQQNKLVDAVHEQVADISRLRAEAAAATRQQDDQLFDIKQLTERLREWQSQANYQQQVLLDLQQVINPNTSFNQANGFSATQSLTQLNEYIAAQRDSLYPSPNVRQLVLANGDVVDAQMLQLGPVTWFNYADQAISGLVDNSSELPSVSQVFSETQQTEIENIFAGKPGVLRFDPTLDQLIKIDHHQETIADHLKKGGTWAIPILFFALIALLIGLIKASTLLRLPKLQPMFGNRLSLIQRKGDTQQELARLQTELKDAQRELVSIALEHSVSQQRDDQLFAYLMNYRHSLERGIGAIALVASISPLLGLLGTVSGMIDTFRMMTLFGAGDPAAVSGGISEALVTTELGLIVAIPALIIHALLNRLVKSRLITLESEAIQLSQLDDKPTNTNTLNEKAA